MWLDGGMCFGDATRSACLDWPASLIFVGAAVVLLAGVLGILVLDARRTVASSEAATRANRHASLSSAVGIALLVVVVMWLAIPLGLGVRTAGGRVAAMVPAIAGVCLLAAQALGELTWPRPQAVQREAELAPRGTSEVVDAWRRRLAYVLAVGLAAALVVFGAAADGPRTILLAEDGRAMGPYPGPYFGVPLAAGVVIVLVGTELVLRLIVLRPAVAGVTADWDLRLRRRSAEYVLRGVHLVLASTLAGVLVVAGVAYLGPGAIMPWDRGSLTGGSSLEGYVGVGLLGLGLAVALAGIVTGFAPRRRRAALAGSTQAVTT